MYVPANKVNDRKMLCKLVNTMVGKQVYTKFRSCALTYAEDVVVSRYIINLNIKYLCQHLG